MLHKLSIATILQSAAL